MLCFSYNPLFNARVVCKQETHFIAWAVNERFGGGGVATHNKLCILCLDPAFSW